MYQRIVVPLDGSALAERALEQAAGLARLTGAPLHLVQVVDVPVTAGLAAEAATLAQALVDEAAAAGAYLDEARRRLTGDEVVEEAAAESFPASDAPARTARPAPALGVGASAVTTELRRGKVAPELLAAARPGDLFVMTPHARGGLARWFLGSVTEEVIRHAPVPVLLVPAAETATEDATAAQGR